MIGFLRGIVFAYGADYLLLDVNGVGYRIAFYHPDALTIGQEVLIYTYQNVREDEISLFGFLGEEEYDLFVRLISVKGIGPKTAASILARSSVTDILRAIELGDISFMKRMPGVGHKVASQIILDLKGKLVVTDNHTAKVKDKISAELNETAAALKTLGYKQAEIDAVLPRIQGKADSAAAYLRLALAQLAR